MSFDFNPIIKFDLNRTLEDRANNNIRGFDFFIDSPHDNKPAHIDLHIYPNEGPGIKYSGLSGVNDLRNDLGFNLPYNKHLTDKTFGW